MELKHIVEDAGGEGATLLLIVLNGIETRNTVRCTDATSSFNRTKWN